ncbi:MAG: hypothetical protein ACUVRC_02060 [Desulfotomaculales bacterium]
MKGQVAGAIIWLIAGLELWLWSDARKKSRPKAKNHLIAGVLLGAAGLILLFASPV